jgi:outer membrane protein assembly factor BamB
MTQGRKPDIVWVTSVATSALTFAGLVVTSYKVSLPFPLSAVFDISDVIAAIAVLILLAMGIPGLVSWIKDEMVAARRAARPRDTVAFTRLWRSTDVSPSLDLASAVASSAAGDPAVQGPFIRVCVRVPCGPLARDASGSLLREQFAGFLSRGPVARLISALACTGGPVTWTELAGDGPRRLEAELTGTGPADRTAASATMTLPVEGAAVPGHRDALAYLWLYAGPRLPGGSVWPTAGLPQWHERFRLVIEVAAEFAHFLTARVDLQTRNAPAVQAGVMLQAPSSIGELVDSGRLRVLPAARPSNEFLGYVIADPAGKPPGDVARSVLTLLCDHAMHLDGFEPILAALGRPSPAAAGGRRSHAAGSGRVRRTKRLAVGAGAAAVLVAGGLIIAAWTVHGTSSVSPWRDRTGNAVLSSPAVVDGTVYVGSTDGKVYALDAATGQVRWAYPTDGAIHSSPAVADGAVYVGSNDDDIYAINAVTGRILWRQDLKNKVASSPAVAHGIVYVGSNDHDVYAFSAATGRVEWIRQTNGSVESSPVVSGATVYVGSDDGRIYALNAAHGGILWTRPTGGFVQSSPVVADGLVYVGSNDGRLYALSSLNGEVRWSRPTGGPVGYSSPTLADGMVFIGSTDGDVSRFDAATGRPEWAFPAGGSVISRPAVADGIVYAGSKDDKLYALSARNGDLRWSYLTGSSVESSPAVSGGLVYFGSDDQAIYALNAATGK